MKKYIEVLKKCPLFFGIEEGEIDAMLHCLGARVDFYDKRYTVFAEGRPAHYVGVVLSGSVQAEQIDFSGNRSIIATYGVSELFGEAFAAAEVRSIPVGMVAGEPSEIMLLDCRRMLYTCSKNCGFHQRMIFNLMRSLAQKTLDYHRKLSIVSKRTTREKLLSYLSSEARRAGENSFSIPYDRQSLADYLEVDRSGLSVEIAKLRAEGVLYSRKNYFVLYNVSDITD